MKLFALSMSIAMLAAACVHGEMLYVVKITDFVKNAEFKAMTAAEKNELQKQIQAETKIFPKVMAQLEKEWKEDDLSKDEPFPKTKLSPRKMMVSGPFDAKQAQKKVESLEERAMDDAFDTGSKKKNKQLSAKKQEKAKEREAKEAQKEAAAEQLAKKLEERIQEALHPTAAPEEKADGDAGEVFGD